MPQFFVGVCIMKAQKPTEPKISACAVETTVQIRTSSLDGCSLSVDQAKAFRRGLSRCIREAEEAQTKGSSQ